MSSKLVRIINIIIIAHVIGAFSYWQAVLCIHLNFKGPQYSYHTEYYGMHFPRPPQIDIRTIKDKRVL